MIRTFLISIFLFICLLTSNGQSYETELPKSYGIVFGYQGFQRDFFEIGVVKGLESSLFTGGISKKKLKMIKKPYTSLYTSLHIDPFENIKGYILGFAYGGGGALGLDFNYYNSERDLWGLRLSYGITILGFETIYRYNFRLSGEKISGISGHLFSIRYYLPLFVKTDDGYKFGEKYNQFLKY
jgi:hypothetical protein